MRDPELVFLGSSGAVQIPFFYCKCGVCEDARVNPGNRRTRASVALLGKETVLIDASPDIELQLDRERLSTVDRIFITHWHFDHIGGLGALGLPASVAGWPPIEIYIPHQVAFHFDQELSYMKKQVNVHPISPGDVIDLPDGRWEVVKTTHTDESVGFVVTSSGKFAYLVDGIEPPAETIGRLKDVDLLILDAIVDELIPGPGEVWYHFSTLEAVRFWKELGTRECILTHIACHNWHKGKLTPGMSNQERLEFESENPGLTFAYDGMRIRL
jgi:phosphoribosyl 1,2-cyclic phosphate phosphodiesterase